MIDAFYRLLLGAPPSTLLERLDTEGAEFVRVLFGTPGAALVLVLAGVWGLALLLMQALSRRSSSAAESSQRLAISVVALVATFGIVLRWVFAVSPLLVTLGLVGATTGVLVAAGLRARDWGGGLAFILQGRVKRGDRLRLGGVEGVVEGIGLFRLALRTDEGRRAFPPVSGLYAGTFEVSSPQRTYSVEVTVARPTPLSDDAQRQLRAVGLMCPFREGGSDVSVTLGNVEGTSATVRLDAWSPRAARYATEYLRRYLADVEPG